ncbi:MAG: hypothetical protein ACK5B5_00500 [Bacteroidota bacterium]
MLDKVRRLIRIRNGLGKAIFENRTKKEAASHRYNRLPVRPSGPGGFSRSWSCRRVQR